MSRVQTQSRLAGSAVTFPSRVKVGSILLTRLTYPLTIGIFFPILWMVLTGLKTEANAVAQPPSLFFQPMFENFQNALALTP